MAKVTIGPFLVNNGQAGSVASGVEHTGYSMELSGDQFAQNICVYRRINDLQPEAIRLEDFFVSVAQIPFALLPVMNFQVQSTVVGKLVSLEAVLCCLYVKHDVTRPFTSVLEEFCQQFPINHGICPRHADGAKLVHPALAQAGFEVIKFLSYGRTLSVLFGWVIPQDRQDSKAKRNVFAGVIEFKPKPDRTFDKGRWIAPDKTTLTRLFTERLELLNPSGLLSDLGLQTALNSFNWTKYSLLTTPEVKLARIDFVRQHPELHNDPQALARALKMAELYSDTAEVYAIKKQVPRLIREARGGEATHKP